MAIAKYDVVGLGNAIVDVLSSTDDAFLAEWNITKNAMNLIDEPRAEELTRVARDPIITSGGSGANTLVGISSFGGKSGFIGKVASDPLGDQFREEIKTVDVAFDTPPLKTGPATARSIIFVNDDGARSMNTFLGASVEFSPEDVDEEMIRDAKLIYLEGYLFDKEAAKAAFVHAAEVARAADREVSLTLSDSFCVDRHRASFLHLIKGHVDVVFANEDEVLSLYETDDFDAAMMQLAADTKVAAVTRSEKGSVVIGAGDMIVVPAGAVDKVIDTTGAGDQYAAGFLFGYTNGLPLETCAKLGHIAAGEVISHFGPRPKTPYKQLAQAQGILA